MGPEFLKHRIGLYLKQIKYSYVTFRNNREVARVFVSEFQVSPFPIAVSLTKTHYFYLTLFSTGFIMVLLMGLFKPISFSKQAPQKISPTFNVENAITKKLTALQPAFTDGLEKIDVQPIISESGGIIPEPVITPVISREEFLNKTSTYTLFVNKRTKKLYVTEKNEKGYFVVEEFPISVGITPGDKELEGDNKTPEGSYTLVDLKMDEELPEKYGPYAAVLNYPNNKDLKEGKTGSGIWIHGTGKNRLTPDTQGCVELSDPNLKKLFSYISKGTKIIISPAYIDISPKQNIVQKDLADLVATS